MFRIFYKCIKTRSLFMILKLLIERKEDTIFYRNFLTFHQILYQY